MKLEVNISKKLGVINITSNSFVLEDLKAHICKKMKLNENDFKMKISFGSVPRVEMIEVRSETRHVVKIKASNGTELYLYRNCYSTLSFTFIIQMHDVSQVKNNILITESGKDISYVSNKSVNNTNDFMDLVDTYLKEEAEQKENKKNPLDPFKQIVQLENEILSKVKEKFSEAEFITTDTNFNGTLKVSIHFKDFKDGEAITYFGDNKKDYNRPIDPQLEKRCSAVYKILKPYLGAK